MNLFLDFLAYILITLAIIIILLYFLRLVKSKEIFGKLKEQYNPLAVLRFHVRGTSYIELGLRDCYVLAFSDRLLILPYINSTYSITIPYKNIGSYKFLYDRPHAKNNYKLYSSCIFIKRNDMPPEEIDLSMEFACHYFHNCYFFKQSDLISLLNEKLI